MNEAETNVGIGVPDHEGTQPEMRGVSSPLPPCRIRVLNWSPVSPVSFGEFGR